MSYAALSSRSSLPHLLHLSVDLREIKEVREGVGTLDFVKRPEEMRMVDPQCGFVIFYGSEFKLKALSVAGEYVTERVREGKVSVPNTVCSLLQRRA